MGELRNAIKDLREARAKTHEFLSKHPEDKWPDDYGTLIATEMFFKPVTKPARLLDLIPEDKNELICIDLLAGYEVFESKNIMNRIKAAAGVRLRRRKPDTEKLGVIETDINSPFAKRDISKWLRNAAGTDKGVVDLFISKGLKGRDLLSSNKIVYGQNWQHIWDWTSNDNGIILMQVPEEAKSYLPELSERIMSDGNNFVRHTDELFLVIKGLRPEIENRLVDLDHT